MNEINDQAPEEFRKKTGLKVISIILIIISIPLLIFESLINVNKRNPFPVDANKISGLIGGIVGSLLIAAIVSYVFFAIKRFIFHRSNNTFLLPFSILLLIVSFVSLNGAIN